MSRFVLAARSASSNLPAFSSRTATVRGWLAGRNQARRLPHHGAVWRDGGGRAVPAGFSI